MHVLVLSTSCADCILNSSLTLLFLYLLPHLSLSLIQQLGQIWRFNFNEFAISYPHRHSLQTPAEKRVYTPLNCVSTRRVMSRRLLLNQLSWQPSLGVAWVARWIHRQFSRFRMMDLKDNITTAVPPPEGKQGLGVCCSLKWETFQPKVSHDKGLSSSTWCKGQSGVSWLSRI